MLRQFLVFYKGEIIFTHSYAIGLDIDELNKAKEIMQKVSVPDKTIQRPILNYQIFHYQKGAVQFSFITDLNDSYNYIDKIIKKTISKFSLFFPNPIDIKEQFSSKEAFTKYLFDVQHELHTKIALVGPLNSGKTTLYNLIRNDDERSIMNVAHSSTVSVGDLKFDIWDNKLNDNYSLLWSKFIGGSDLVIFLFDASNYNLKVLNHFLNLHKRESSSARLVVIANKSDLISKDEIKRVKTELDNIEIKELSLVATNAKARIYRIISNALLLKKSLPSNFEDLIKQAEGLEEKGNTVAALAKYKELINICISHQELEHEDEFKHKCDELNLKLSKEREERRKEQKKIKFTPSHSIQFSDKVIVKKLPSVKPTADSTKAKSEVKVKTIAKSKMINSKVQTKTQKLNKLKLKPGDIKINLQGVINQEKLTKEPITQRNLKSRKSITPKLEIDFATLKTDRDFAKALQIMIERKGSDLNIELCLEFINQMKTELNRELLHKDLLLATDAFLEQEKG